MKLLSHGPDVHDPLVKGRSSVQKSPCISALFTVIALYHTNRILQEINDLNQIIVFDYISPSDSLLP